MLEATTYRNSGIPENREFKKMEIQFLRSKTYIVHEF